MSNATQLLALAGASILSSALTYLAVSGDSHDRSKKSVSFQQDQKSESKRQNKGTPKDAEWLPRLETKSNKPLEGNNLGDKLTLDDVDWDGKRVLIRVDYNVPIQNGVVTDTNRIEATLETLRFILDRKGPKGGAKAIVLITHLGQPAGNFDRSEFTLAPVAKALEGLLRHPVKFLSECIGPNVEKEINNCEPGSIFLLENLRFHKEEIGEGKDSSGKKVKCSPEEVQRFRDALSRLGDLFVFEAFGAAHRPHSSISGISIPVRVAGKLMQKELGYFAKVLGNPERPFLAILGGAKISDKIMVIENLLNIADEIIIGGGMAYTFKKVNDGVKIGASLFDEPGAQHVKRILELAEERGVKLHLPIDHVIADKFSADARTGVTDDEAGVPDGWMALDIGPRTRANFAEVMSRAKTIVWNGPMGVFEKGPFAAGTMSIMVECVRAAKGPQKATVIIGGGDTGAASNQFFYQNASCADQVTHVSTGGGSTLVLMEGKMLPGVDHISDRSEYLDSLKR